MSRPLLSAFVGCALIGLVGRGVEAGWNWVWNVQPASLAINLEDQFGVTDESGARVMLGPITFMPNLSTGVGYRYKDLLADLTVGAGILYNESFQSFLYQAQLGLHYAASDSLGLGAHGGLVRLAGPEWMGNQDLSFDDANGYRVGAHLTLGDRLMYLVCVDLMRATLDPRPETRGLTLETDQLEFSALVIEFGVRGEF